MAAQRQAMKKPGATTAPPAPAATKPAEGKGVGAQGRGSGLQAGAGGAMTGARAGRSPAAERPSCFINETAEPLSRGRGRCQPCHEQVAPHVEAQREIGILVPWEGTANENPRPPSGDRVCPFVTPPHHQPSPLPPCPLADRGPSQLVARPTPRAPHVALSVAFRHVGASAAEFPAHP